MQKLDHSKQIFKPNIFPFITALYGAITYSIIVGGLFQSSELVFMFLPLALLTGFIFGVTYALLIRSKKLIDFLNKQQIFKIAFILSPAIIVLFFLCVLPMIAPSLVFRYMPDKIQDKIIARTIPKFKVGDDIEPLKNALPGYLDNIQNGKGNMMASIENFAFVLQVNCGKIIRLEYGKNSSHFDNTIYGKLEEKPCR